MRVWILILAGFLATAVVFGAGDHMKSYSAEVCGASVTMDLHPDMTQPAVKPRAVDESDIPKPGDIDDFIHVM